MSRPDASLDKHHLGKGKGAEEVSGFALLSAQRSDFDHPGKPVSVHSGVRMGLSHDAFPNGDGTKRTELWWGGKGLGLFVD